MDEACPAAGSGYILVAMAPTLLLLLLAAPDAHAAPTVAALRAGLESSSGWEEVDRRAVGAAGEVVVRHKQVEGADCLEGTATAGGPVELYATLAADIDHQAGWSTWKIPYSKKLSSGASFDYAQVLDNPYPVADRFWFLRGSSFTSGAERGFRWEPIDGKTAWPQAWAEVATKFPGAIIPAINVGDWTFTPVSASQTRVRYRICTDAGGNLPDWAGQWAATKTLPTNIADLVGEVKRRTGA